MDPVVDLAHQEVLLGNQLLLVRESLPEPPVELLQPLLPPEIEDCTPEPPRCVELSRRPGPRAAVYGFAPDLE